MTLACAQEGVCPVAQEATSVPRSFSQSVAGQSQYGVARATRTEFLAAYWTTGMASASLEPR
jgi:hypothetical protein